MMAVAETLMAMAVAEIAALEAVDPAEAMASGAVLVLAPVVAVGLAEEAGLAMGWTVVPVTVERLRDSTAVDRVAATLEADAQEEADRAATATCSTAVAHYPIVAAHCPTAAARYPPTSSAGP